MKPHLDDKDYQMFLKKILWCDKYLEFGCGGSTFEAIKHGVYECISIESDREWIDKVKKEVGEQPLFIHKDIGTKPNTWGYPAEDCTDDKKRRYSDFPDCNPDLIMIDGRFRVACCLKCWEHIDEETVIFFDDFLNREYYHIVLNYYDIIEKGTRAVVLKKKDNQPTKDVIEFYELNPK